jgi:hypothetical protein
LCLFKAYQLSISVTVVTVARDLHHPAVHLTLVARYELLARLIPSHYAHADVIMITAQTSWAFL